MSQAIIARSQTATTAFAVLGAITFCHLLNDVMQALLPAIYPMLKSGFSLSFGQIGLLTLIFQVTASLLQPMVGLYTDRRPQPYSLPLGMACSLLGMVTLAFAPSFPALLAGAAFLGIGSSIFHPESSRLARLASGGAHGFAQSFFQVGGHVGSALGPLLAAFVVLPQGRSSLAWFALAALLGMCILMGVGRWYKGAVHSRAAKSGPSVRHTTLPPSQVRRAILRGFVALRLHERFGCQVHVARLYTAMALDLGIPLTSDLVTVLGAFRADIAAYERGRPFAITELKIFDAASPLPSIGSELDKARILARFAKLRIFVGVMICPIIVSLEARIERLHDVFGGKLYVGERHDSRDHQWQWCFACASSGDREGARSY